ncbi:ATP-binding protein [Polycladidibacter hongkongensis]|uniref:ATP-binding protein n=1 Tax=Polycladidibacter hongkongensis TaxID=1647556 RepID=UPI00082C36CD|nr:ATP-binding protein [Pseudovibrio hongkongensis]
MVNFKGVSLPRWLSPLLAPYRFVAGWLHRHLPKGLYSRALLIIIMPMVILQSVLAFAFMERHYDLVTQRLSQAVVKQIRAVVTMDEEFSGQKIDEQLKIVAGSMSLSLAILPLEPLPPPKPKPFFDLVDRYMSRQIATTIDKPFWIDTIGNSRFVEIRIQMPDKTLKFVARRSQAHASNSHIFIVWMVATSFVLVTIAVLFLRNQIRPIVQLANAAERFGKGRELVEFRPHGAREVRKAALAFMDMRRRIERHVDQRTTMLAGVSHDLRTILTRFRLQLALFEDSPEVQALRDDVDEMSRMLEDYLSFSKGSQQEQPTQVDVALMLEDLEVEAEVVGAQVSSHFEGDPNVILKAQSFRRCLLNLVSNAARHGKTVRMQGNRTDDWLVVTIDDDGPGIPPEERENVFRPFLRLDTSRNQDTVGSGLGLAIARDIVRSHGGDIFLREAPLGGLRVRLRVPI